MYTLPVDVLSSDSLLPCKTSSKYFTSLARSEVAKLRDLGQHRLAVRAEAAGRRGEVRRSHGQSIRGSQRQLVAVCAGAHERGGSAEQLDVHKALRTGRQAARRLHQHGLVLLLGAGVSEHGCEVCNAPGIESCDVSIQIFSQEREVVVEVGVVSLHVAHGLRELQLQLLHTFVARVPRIGAHGVHLEVARRPRTLR